LQAYLARAVEAGVLNKLDIAETILASSADAILATDAAGMIRFWNAGAVRLFGFAAEESLGKSLDLVIPERLRARHWEGYRRVMRTGASRYSQGDVLAVPALRKDGQEISVEFTITPLKGAADEMVGMAAVIRDVTARFNELKELRRRAASSQTPGAGRE
jgi:PAS domain S-box-containing protein